jgi:copper chaperone CopZ
LPSAYVGAEAPTPGAKHIFRQFVEEGKKMFRRQFVQIVALGTSSVATIATVDAKGGKTVTYVVKGFSCITCAVGLDTMLQKQKGVSWSNSIYPDGVVKIQFDPQEISEKTIKEFIGEMGFTVEQERTA